jgi:hypothetical protein
MNELSQPTCTEVQQFYWTQVNMPKNINFYLGGAGEDRPAVLQY